MTNKRAQSARQPIAPAAATTAEPPRETVRISVGALDGHGSIRPVGDETDARDQTLATLMEVSHAPSAPPAPSSEES